MGNLGEPSEEPRRVIRSTCRGQIQEGGIPHQVMARRDSLTWFMMGLAQIMIGDAILEAGTSEVMGQLIQMTGGGTIALGIYFLLFLARNESEFSELYSKAEKTVLEVDPSSGKKKLVDNSPKGVKAVWYTIPVAMTFLGLMAWLIA